MSFGSFFKKISNPMNAIDPAGSAIRAATGNTAVTGRSMLDPSGKILTRPGEVAPPVQRQGYVSRLSPGAQAIKDRMLARRQERMAPPTPTPPPRGGMGAVASRAMNGLVQQMPQAQMQNQMVGMADPRQMVYADGGQVKRSGKKAAPSTKVFNRKPNGKPF